jgi:hypothetical protein
MVRKLRDHSHSSTTTDHAGEMRRKIQLKLTMDSAFMAAPN